MNKAQVDTFTANPSALKDAPHRLIYHTLLDPASPLKLTQASLCDEAGLFLVAGTDTVSNASTIGVMYTLYSDILPRLREELLQVWPRLDEPPSLEVLEGLQILVCLNLFHCGDDASSLTVRRAYREQSARKPCASATACSPP